MTIQIPIHNDSEYVAIRIVKESSPAPNLYCLKAELFKKNDPSQSHLSDKLFFEHLILSDSSKPVSREILSDLFSLVNKKMANFAITKDKDGLLGVIISPKK